jgi:hypothetical protein
MHLETTTSDPAAASAPLDPIAVCTLAPESRDERLAWILDEILPHAVGCVRGTDSISWELEDAPGLTEKLDQLVVLEQQCCAGILFEHAASATAGRLRLNVKGVDPQSAVFADQPFREANPGLGRRISRSLGLGSVVSLVLCCVLPIAGASVLGAAAAAPFASLDNPLVMLGVVVIFGGGAFLWQNRRRASCERGC